MFYLKDKHALITGGLYGTRVVVGTERLADAWVGTP